MILSAAQRIFEAFFPPSTASCMLSDWIENMPRSILIEERRPQPMKLNEILHRKQPPAPWEEGEKIPWDDPAFSERMLEMHLSQEHDWASRRLDLVDRHVDWLEERFLSSGSRVLDLGCGPGLYTHRLARRGHRCLGLDFSPASIKHARQQAEAEDVEVRYEQADIREAEFGAGFDLVMMIFGEFNVFRPGDAERVLRKAFDALVPGGHVLVEGHTYGEVKRQGESPPFWQALECSVFAEHPHLWLEEHFWHPECDAATTRYLVTDLLNGETVLHASTMQAYPDAHYERLLTDAGFSEIGRYPDLGRTGSEFEGKLQVFAGKKGAG